MNGIALPGDSGALVSENLFGLVERCLGGLPTAEHERGDAANQLEHSSRLRRVELPSQIIGRFQEFGDSPVRPRFRLWTDTRPPWRST